MPRKKGAKRLLVAGTSAGLALCSTAIAQAASPDNGDEVTEVVITGTRVANRSALDTAAPVDVVSAAVLQSGGSTEINQALSSTLPSFSFPRPSLNDGTDTVRPATLRGLAPDQTLVLVNSKRQHAASLVNINGSIGRGSSAVDLNTIPIAMVQTIEVLRDGASAQYGSDAIAGVINVRLREARDGGGATLGYSQYNTDVKTLTGTLPAGATWPLRSDIKRNDGGALMLSGWKGLALGESGFLTLAAEYKDQKHTERDGYDVRQQYPLVAGAFDPRELTINRYNAWYGDPELKQTTVSANAGDTLGNGVKLYGWANYQKRDSRSAGFFRRALDPRNVIAIYPGGFLPIIAPAVTDLSTAFGAAWTAGAWGFDTSLTYGRNKMAYTIENTLNASDGAASRTQFDAGGFWYDQFAYNLSGVRSVDVSAFHSPLNVAAGLEARSEGYAIFAGEPHSYLNGGVPLPNGSPAASGSQVFPGFQPKNEVNKRRSSVGAYLDLEANVTEKFLASVAARAEHYSDFGNNVSGKLALRYDFTPAFALRASVQNGFRAPSLQQQFFTATSTNSVVVNGVAGLIDTSTLPPTDPVSAALGAKPLEAEKSTNYSLGAVFRVDRFSLTVDAYQINITNRIVLSENLTASNVIAYLATQGITGVGAVRFFINGVDTTTKGVDLVANLPLPPTAAGKFDLTLAANFNSTDVNKVPQTAQLAALNPAPVLFGRLNTLTFEKGNPKDKFSFAGNWKLGRWGATLRATRYGDALSPSNDPTGATDFHLTAKTLVDISATAQITGNLEGTLGIDNVGDTYPDTLPPNLNTTGNTPFPGYSPFGWGGRMWYARLGLKF
jgi:iron complex outermembrane recepter protein